MRKPTRYERFRRPIFWGIFWRRIRLAWPGLVIGWVSGGAAIAALMLATEVTSTITSTSVDLPPLEIVTEGGVPPVFKLITALMIFVSATAPAVWLAYLDAKAKILASLREKVREVINNVMQNDPERAEQALEKLESWPVEADEESIGPLLEDILEILDNPISSNGDAKQGIS